jgi:CHAD domain-containing protein
MHPRQLRRHWRRALAANLRRARELLRRGGPLNADAVHDLRVALRRSRLLLQLRSKRRDRQRTKRHRAAARKLLDAFAPVRDCDVAIEWVRARHASTALSARLLRRRTTLYRQAGRKLAKLRTRLQTDRLKKGCRTDPDKLARRFERWLGAMAARSLAAARKARQLPTPELHALRRDIRRWRYLRELLVSPRALARDRTIRRLVAAQEALGAIQNLEVVLAALRGCGRSKEVTALKRVARLNLAVSRAAALRELRHFAAPQAPVA